MGIPPPRVIPLRHASTRQRHCSDGAGEEGHAQTHRCVESLYRPDECGNGGGTSKGSRQTQGSGPRTLEERSVIYPDLKPMKDPERPRELQGVIHCLGWGASGFGRREGAYA